MTKRMLIDATSPGEVRVAVVGNKLEDYDIEVLDRKPTKGNIYLAQVTRVEPSLQAAFLNYKLGTDQRQGFLAFPEIHTDYYRIPVADREALEEYQAQERERNKRRDAEEDAMADAPQPQQPRDLSALNGVTQALRNDASVSLMHADRLEEITAQLMPVPAQMPFAEGETHDAPEEIFTPLNDTNMESDGDQPETNHEAMSALEEASDANDDADDGSNEDRVRRRRMIRYKIQEVVKRRQIMLVQVVKEERGAKGAAVTSYISLPGRYCVLMPNSSTGGGVSRKINNQSDRRRMREILSQLDVPDGMSVILRTAGLERPVDDIKKDLSYLLRLWDQIREKTLTSTAPALVYEEGDLIRRSIRDLVNDQISEILVAGQDAFNTARDFMATLMPSHVDRIKHYKDPVSLFTRYDVERQIDSIHEPTVQMRSGGYIVINQTEALVAVDVNSGRATKERNIEETALKTNLEAADELARQIRLRDLAGLVVVDFIDMENMRNRIAVERRLKEAMKNDRARIQIGRISSFGLLELSRQRLRSSLAETDFSVCPHCVGTGHVRSLESSARAALRALEEECLKNRSRDKDITLHVPSKIALHILNNLRGQLVNLEQRNSLSIWVQGDDSVIEPAYKIERTEKRNGSVASTAVSYESVGSLDDALDFSAAPADNFLPFQRPDTNVSEEQDEKSPRRNRNRRSRGGNNRRDTQSGDTAPVAAMQPELPEDAFAAFASDQPVFDNGDETGEAGSSRARNSRRRGRRGGRGRVEGATPDYSQMPPLDDNGFEVGLHADTTAPKDANYHGHHGLGDSMVEGASNAPSQAQQNKPANDHPAMSPPPQSDSPNTQSDDASKRGWWQRLLEG